MQTFQTDELSIAYDDTGSGERGIAVLLHGRPDDASTWAAVAPMLNQAGLHDRAHPVRLRRHAVLDPGRASYRRQRVGGAKAIAKITVPHEDLLLSGKTVRGVMDGGTTPDFHLALMRLQAQGRFPLERLVRRYPFAEVNKAVDDSDPGEAIKPILIMEPGAV